MRTENEEDEIVMKIQYLAKEALCEKKRDAIEIEHFNEMHLIIEKYDKEITKEVLRFLRNSCAGSTRNQNIIKSTTCPSLIVKYLVETDRDISILRLALQFFGNFIQGNEETCKIFIDSIKHDMSILEALVSSSDNLTSKYASHVTLTVLKMFPSKMKNFVSGIQTVCDKLDNEYCLLIVEELTVSNDFKIIYEDLDGETKIKVLEILDAAEIIRFNSETIQYLVQKYQANADLILKFDPIEVDEHKLRETLQILKLLMQFIAINPNSEIQSNPALLVSTLYLLKFLHDASLTENSPFKLKEKLSDFEAVLRNSERNEKSLGIEFKSNLIRFIGNLVYQMKEQQDLLRASDGIPLLFSSCRLDANNPTIIQNTIFTIRNLVEKNEENQIFIKEIMKKPVQQDESEYRKQINNVLYGT